MVIHHQQIKEIMNADDSITDCPCFQHLIPFFTKRNPALTLYWKIEYGNSATIVNCLVYSTGVFNQVEASEVNI